MFYILAIIVPPVPVLIKGIKSQFLFSIILTLLGWLPGAMYAFLVIAMRDKNLIKPLPFEKIKETKN